MRRRGVHLSRTTVALLAALATWFVVISGLLSLLQRPPVRRWMAHRFAEQASHALGQRVVVDELRAELMPPCLALFGVEVGPTQAPLLVAQELQVGPGSLRLGDREVVIDSLRMRGVRLRWRVPELTRGEPSRSWLRVRVKHAEIVDWQVDELTLPAGVVLRVRDLDAMVAGSRRTPLDAAVLRAGRVQIEAPGIEPIAASVQVWGRGEPGGFEIRRLAVVGEKARIDGRGVVRGRTVRGEGVAAVDLAWLDEAVHIRADLEGEVDLGWKVELGQDAVFSVGAHVQAKRVSAAGFEVTDLDGEIHLTPDGIEGSLVRGQFAGGRVEGSYRLGAFAEPWPHVVAVRGNGVRLSSFLDLLGVDSAGLGAVFSTSGEVAWNGEDIGSGRGAATAELRSTAGDVPASGRVHVALDGDGALTFSSHALSLDGAATSWNGGLTLGSWIPSWRIQVKRARMETVARLLHGWVGTQILPEPLRGEAAIDLQLQGPFDDLTVIGDVAVAPASFGPVEVDGLQTSVRIAAGVARFEDGLVFVGPGRVSCEGELAFERDGGLAFEIAGEGIPLDRAVAWSGLALPVAGQVAMKGRLSGTLDTPRLDGSLDVSRVVAAGVPFGDGGGRVTLEAGLLSLDSLRVGGFAADAQLDLHRRLARVDASVAGFGLHEISPPLGRLAGGEMDIRLQGSFPFDAPAGRLQVTSARGGHGFVELGARGVRLEVVRPGVWRLDGELGHQDIGFAGRVHFAVESFRLLGRDLAGFDVPADGYLAGAAEVRLAPPAPALIEGTVNELSVTLEGEEARAGQPFDFRIEGGHITVGELDLVGERANLHLGGVREADGSISGRVDGELPLALLALVWTDARPTGVVTLHAEISGTDHAPRLAGKGVVKEGALQVPELPGPVTHINGTLLLIPEAVRLEDVQFSLLGGTGRCSGQVVFEPRIELDLAMHVNRLRWPLGAGLNPVLAGEARLVGPLDNLSLTGDTTLQRTLYTRSVDLQKLIVEGVTAPVRARAADVAPVAFNLNVKAPGTFEVSTALARLVARGELRVVGTSAQPGVLGRLEALPGGELEVTGVRYELLRGQVSFTDPEAIEPYLDLLARTNVQGFEITVGLVGTLDRMTPTFVANPPLPEMDIISLLSFGRRADEAGSLQAGTIASTFFTDQLTSAVARRARTLLDVDQLRVDPFAATQSGDPTARLTVVKQLSPNWTVTLATNLTANREEVITSRYRLGPGLFLDGARQADGSYSMEIRWQHRY